MKILVNRYHPVSEDLAITLARIFPQATIYLSVNTEISDHYGKWQHVYEHLKDQYREFETITLTRAALLIKQKQIDLVLCDGVFDGDKLLMDLCAFYNVSLVNIQGYPYTFDENAKNILSLGWFLPQIQYVKQYPSEGHVKQIDWKNIFENQKSGGKNVCVFYPNFWNFKKFVSSVGFTTDKLREETDRYISAIHRYEECNEWPFKVFGKVKEKLNPTKIENMTGLTSVEVFNKCTLSKGALMLKAFDQPGIFLFEAMLSGLPIFTMKSYVLGSFNQDVLIDGFNACVADTVDELILRMKSDEWKSLSKNTFHHVDMLTSFERQQHKLKTFIENSLDNK